MLQPAPKGYVCYRPPRPLSLNGKLDDPSWRAAPWTDAFVDIEGARADARDAKPKPRFVTRAKMLWDDAYFYLGADLQEPHVWGTLTQHDAVIFQDNDFEVFIDPDGDNHQYYEIEINALNTVWDLRLAKPYRDGGRGLNEWECVGMKTAVHVDGTLNNPDAVDRGWSVELALPWKSLAEFANRPCPPREGDQWRVNFSRVEWEHEIVDGKYRKVAGKREDNWVWSPQGVIDMHRPEHWGYVQFTSAPIGKTKFKPDPSLPARELLIRIYYAQRDFYAKNKRWATMLAELALDVAPSRELPRPPGIVLTDGGYDAIVELKWRDGTTQRWRIQQDSRIQRTGYALDSSTHYMCNPAELVSADS